MCKFCKLLYWLIPGKNFQASLIKKHIASCSQCQKEIEEANNRIKETSIIPNWVNAEDSLWPKIKQKIYAQEEKTLKIKRKHLFSLPGKWRWTMACLFIALMIGLSLVIRYNFFVKTSKEETYFTKENPRIRIKYAEILGEKAKPYIYQTQKASFIWLSKNDN